MKVICRHDFMKLPEGTIYAKGKEWYFDGTFIKGETLKGYDGEDIDWYYTDPNTAISYDSGEMFDILEKSLKTGTSFEGGMNVLQRDGMFDVDDLFMVWEEQDNINFKKALK